MDAELDSKLGYVFDQPALLRQALTHRSFGVQHNERLEFIGDGLLNCVIALALFARFPQLAEGDLSRLRSNLVNRDSLYLLAQKLGLHQFLRLGEGEIKTGGGQRPSILADAMEALIGAVFLDGGFDAAQQVVERLYADLLDNLDPEQTLKDPKTRLQELLQARHLPLPTYTVAQISGEAHNQTFRVSCRIDSLGVEVTGTGNSRRAAEQEAAQAAYLEAMRE